LEEQITIVTSGQHATRTTGEAGGAPFQRATDAGVVRATPEELADKIGSSIDHSCRGI
jgi:hypothetical protein